jgi:hypothetical protein
MTGMLSSLLQIDCLFQPLMAKGTFLRSEADTGQMMVWILGAGGIIAVVCGSLMLYTKIAHKRKTDSHGGLFSELCKLHELDRGSRQLLNRAVKCHELDPPSRIFTEPNWLDPANLNAEFKSQVKALKKLRSRLFGAAAKAGKPKSKKATGRK